MAPAIAKSTKRPAPQHTTSRVRHINVVIRGVREYARSSWHILRRLSSDGPCGLRRWLFNFIIKLYMPRASNWIPNGFSCASTHRAPRIFWTLFVVFSLSLRFFMIVFGWLLTCCNYQHTPTYKKWNAAIIYLQKRKTTKKTSTTKTGDRERKNCVMNLFRCIVSNMVCIRMLLEPWARELTDITR